MTGPRSSRTSAPRMQSISRFPVPTNHVSITQFRVVLPDAQHIHEHSNTQKRRWTGISGSRSPQASRYMRSAWPGTPYIHICICLTPISFFSRLEFIPGSPSQSHSKFSITSRCRRPTRPLATKTTNDQLVRINELQNSSLRLTPARHSHFVSESSSSCSSEESGRPSSLSHGRDIHACIYRPALDQNA